MPNQLEQLKSMTTVVADTGDFNSIADFKPQDATTNPSLLLKAVSIPEVQPLVEQAVAYAQKTQADVDGRVEAAGDFLSVLIGNKLLSLIPGRVSTEVDARLSFDTQATINKARKIVSLYQSIDIDPSRILIKIASTWEGIRAAEVLEKEGINCNLTLLFSFAQARACAEAGVFLISPFVGRITDWYKAKTGQSYFAPSEDPGVRSVTQIYHYYKAHAYQTIVMGASFRNTEQIIELAGCDRLTISPDLMQQMMQCEAAIEQKLSPTLEVKSQPEKMSEQAFRWALNQDPMATEKTAEGIRQFAADQEKLEAILRQTLGV